MLKTSGKRKIVCSGQFVSVGLTKFYKKLDKEIRISLAVIGDSFQQTLSSVGTSLVRRRVIYDVQWL